MKGWVVLQVHQNDDYRDADRAATSIVEEPTKGTVEVVGSNIRYTLHDGVTGSDSFVYRACNGRGSCDTATVTLDIAPG